MIPGSGPSAEGAQPREEVLPTVAEVAVAAVRHKCCLGFADSDCCVPHNSDCLWPACCKLANDRLHLEGLAKQQGQICAQLCLQCKAEVCQQ